MDIGPRHLLDRGAKTEILLDPQLRVERYVFGQVPDVAPQPDRIMVEVDPSGGPALYTIHCQEKNQPETYILLDTGLLLGFEYGQIIDRIRFEKPSMTPSGMFVLDNVIMQLVTAPVSQNGASPNNP